MFVKDQLAFDPSDPGFLEDPYPVLNRVRESARVFYDERRDRWFVTRHEDVRACLRDRRLGRNFRHVMSSAEFDVPVDSGVAANQAAAEFTDYVRSLIDERRAQPGDDMVSALVDARVDGARLSDDQIVSTVIVLLNAGHEASVNTLGNGMLAFARHPEEWRRVVGGDVEAATAGEEMIRFDPPLQLLERWVLTD